ncbi:MAG TPA: T9SS type A sorting domain-containing protein [Brumimicrobium sp.]|nr:T9SS type A sorting domain-containing protein [Brumimicrobium sp.]
MKSILLILLLFPLSSLVAQSYVSISPNEANHGETLNVTITGTNTSFSQASNTSIKFYFTASSTTATIPNYYNVQNNNTIIANLTVPLGTYTGWYDYSVGNGIDGLMYNPVSFKVNGVVGLTAYNTNTSYKVYPNPFSNSLSVSVSSEQSGNATLRLIDLTGKVYESRPVSLVNGQNTFEMDNLNLESGIYFVQLTYPNGKRLSTKIIKE